MRGSWGTRTGALLVLLTSLALAGPARADVFCAPSPCSDGTQKPTIKDAIDAADTQGGPDVVSIKAGTWNGPAGQLPLQVNQPGTEVHGAGIGRTILTVSPLPSDAGYQLTIISGYMSRLADLTLRLPSAVTTDPHNGSVKGADVYNGTVERVRVDAPGAHFGRGGNDGRGEGLLLRGGTMRDSSIALGAGKDTEGLDLIGTTTVSDVSIDAAFGLSSDPQADPNPHTEQARRLRITAQFPVSVGDGFLRLADSLLDARPASTTQESSAISANNGRPPDPAGLTMDRVTVVGNGASNQSALSVFANGGSKTTLTARHLVAAGFGRTLVRGRFGGDITVKVDHSNLARSPVIANEGPGGGAIATTFGPGSRTGNPLFVAPSTGDFRLGFGSPAIDIGGPDLIPVHATDLGGAARPREGDGDGTAQSD